MAGLKTVFSEKHAHRDVRTELFGGELGAPFECPKRAELIKARVLEVGLGPAIDPTGHAVKPILAVHDAAYVAFLETAFERYQAAGFKGEAIAFRLARPAHDRPLPRAYRRAALVGGA